MTETTPDLVRRLSSGLTPVEPVASVPVAWGRLVGGLMALFVGGLLLVEPRDDVWGILVTPWLWVETGLLVGLVLWSAFALATLRLPGAPRGRPWGAVSIAGMALWMGVFTAGAFVRDEGVTAFALETPVSLGCALKVLLFATPAFALFVGAARRGFATSPWKTAFFASLGAFAFALALVSWTCPDDTFAHVALWHGVPTGLLGALGVAVARWLVVRRAALLRGWALVPFAILAGVGVLVQASLSDVETEPSRLVFGGALQGASVLAGVAVGVGLQRLVALEERTRRGILAWLCLALALTPTLLALVSGTRGHGLPYLSLGGWHIHATEFTAAFAVLSSAAFLSRDAFGFGGLGAIAPLLLLSSFGGPTGAWSFGIALAAMWALTVLAPGHTPEPKRGWNLLALIPLVPIAFLPVLKALRASPLPSQPTIHGPWVVADAAAGAHAHTEFVLGALAADGGSAVAWGVVGLFGLGCVLLLWRATASRNVFTRLLGVGYVVFLATQAAWNGAAGRGHFPTPASGTFFPFLSYGVSYTLPNVALLVILWARFRREARDAASDSNGLGSA